MFLMPRRMKKTKGRYAKVDGIPFTLPVSCIPSPVLMAAFPINAQKAKAIMPNEIHPFKLWNDKALLVVTVINYLDTNIGKYIEYSVAIACTHGFKPAPKMLPGIFQRFYNTGQYVLDLPVSSEVSVKGGKGIWGMPKHQANLNFRITEEKVTSQYDKDDKLVNYIEIYRPGNFSFPVRTGAANYCAFRGMLMKSSIFITGKAQMAFGKKAKARFVVGDHPRADSLRELEIEENPLFTAYIPDAVGRLDDHIESWFIHQDNNEFADIEGLESVVNLEQNQDWLKPPTAEIKAALRSEEKSEDNTDEDKSDHQAA